jgi:hypothetical protein
MTPVTFSVGPGYAPSVAWNRDAFLVAIDSVPYGAIRELRWAGVDDAGQIVTSKVIEHPTRPSRIFLQTVEWIPENVPRQRSVRH